MHLSSTLCRTQHSYQRDRAATAQLANARLIAGAAAKAWEREALAAEEREERQSRTRTLTKAIPIYEPQPSSALDRLLSENPDREFPND
jgi:hypothetical protein